VHGYNISAAGPGSRDDKVRGLNVARARFVRDSGGDK
jgi:hypothetical protein